MTTTSNPLIPIPLSIPSYWSPYQAQAVIELLDELRNLIWAHYGLQVIDEYHNPNPNPSEPPF
jgi:hypothetical protein